jgi:hypothetical protein
VRVQISPWVLNFYKELDMDIKDAEKSVKTIVDDLQLVLKKAKEEDEKNGGRTDHDSNVRIKWIKSISDNYWIDSL